MSIGASRADRLGFTVFIVLAALLAALIVTNLGSNDSAESAETTEVATFAGLPEPTPLPTTAPVLAPESTPAPAPLDLPTATPSPAIEPATSTADESDDSDDSAETTSTLAASSAEQSGDSGTPSSTAGQGEGSAVPNPQPQATATAVPNPQPQATSVPNPQPGTPPIGNIPADAPAGGTFTRTLTAIVSQPTLYNQPGGSPFMPTFNGQSLPPVNPTVFGNPLVYRVLAGEPGDAWAKVYVPARPNGTVAWVQTSQFNWGSSNRLIQINVSNNTVTIYEGSNVLLTTTAVTGKSSSRTPLANGWVEEIMPGPSGAYGPLLISLGIFSDDLNSFGGSVPKIALHGTNNPSLMGQYASNGCIRVRNEIITQIAGLVQPGSKVVITA